MPGYLVDRWKQIEPNAAIQNQVAKQTALHALLRRPIGVATLGAKTFLGYWDFSQMRRSAKSDLETTFPWERQISRVATHFRLSPPERRDTKVRTLLQRYQVRAQPYYYVVLLSPFVSSGLILFLSEGYAFLLFLHSWILLGTITLFTMVPTVRYLQPLSLLTILIFAALVRAVIDRRSSRHRRGAINIIHHLATDPTSPSQ